MKKYLLITILFIIIAYLTHYFNLYQLLLNKIPGLIIWFKLNAWPFIIQYKNYFLGGGIIVCTLLLLIAVLIFLGIISHFREKHNKHHYHRHY